MASSWRTQPNSHKRQNVCTNRPLYRDGRRERAVKVFTINQESRYLLVHGVPDINITDELLKLFSLYGAIEEYRTIDDDPEAEQFTKTHWIKYANIQAARVAKRKMDDHSFYGGFLHVSYAPEYESIQDTRDKLQHRRMDVARRLRNLAQERAQNDDDDIETISTSSTSQDDNGSPDDKPSPASAWGPRCSSHSQPPQPGQPSQQIHPAYRDHPSSTTLDGHQHDEQSHQGGPLIPPSLPEPPRSLPPWQCNIPSQPDFPRLRTKHDTLPAGFNPFPDGDGQVNQDGMRNPHQITPPAPPMITSSQGAFIGPLRPPVAESANPLVPSAACSSTSVDQNYRQSGARPKERFSPSSNTCDSPRDQRTDQHPMERHADGRSHSPSSSTHSPSQPEGNFPAQPEGKSPMYHEGNTHSQHGQSPGQRPKLVPKRRLGPKPPSNPNEGVNGGQKSTPHAACASSHHPFLPRPVSTRAKRSASSVEDEDDDQEINSGQTTPATGNSSFDRTVSTVREQMLQVSQAGQTGRGPSSVIQSAIIRAMNQERMGLLPRRPPTKRQRI